MCPCRKEHPRGVVETSGDPTCWACLETSSVVYSPRIAAAVQGYSHAWQAHMASTAKTRHSARGATLKTSKMVFWDASRRQCGVISAGSRSHKAMLRLPATSVCYRHNGISSWPDIL